MTLTAGLEEKGSAVEEACNGKGEATEEGAQNINWTQTRQTILKPESEL